MKSFMPPRLLHLALLFALTLASCTNKKEKNIKAKPKKESSHIKANDLTTHEKNGPCDSPDFDASYRKTVKFTPSKSKLEKNININALLENFEKTHHDFYSHKKSLPNDKRLPEEERNVQLPIVYIYTFKRQADEDYHVIFGTTPDMKTAAFFNSEISGLSPANTYRRSDLVAARDAFEQFFGIRNKCAADYYDHDYRKNPVPVSIEGSLFFDGEHCTAYKHLGPQKWKNMGVLFAWELHPITKITFLQNNIQE